MAQQAAGSTSHDLQTSNGEHSSEVLAARSLDQETTLPKKRRCGGPPPRVDTPMLDFNNQLLNDDFHTQRPNLSEPFDNQGLYIDKLFNNEPFNNEPFNNRPISNQLLNREMHFQEGTGASNMNDLLGGAQGANQWRQVSDVVCN